MSATGDESVPLWWILLFALMGIGALVGVVVLSGGELIPSVVLPA